MPDLYSVSLTLAMLAAGGAVAAMLWPWIAERSGAQARSSWARAARGLAVAALLLVAFSGVHHLLTGHPPGTPRAMRPLELVREHPAPAGVAVVAALVLVRLGRRAGRRGR